MKTFVCKGCMNTVTGTGHLFAIFWIFWSKMKITQANLPTIRMDCHPILTNSLSAVNGMNEIVCGTIMMGMQQFVLHVCVSVHMLLHIRCALTQIRCCRSCSHEDQLGCSHQHWCYSPHSAIFCSHRPQNIVHDRRPCNVCVDDYLSCTFKGWSWFLCHDSQSQSSTYMLWIGRQMMWLCCYLT